MRIWPRSGGKHPALDANSLHLWSMDEAAAASNALDVIGTADCVQTGSPTLTDGPVNFRSRTLDGSTDYFRSAVYTADMTPMQSCTVAGMFKMSTGWSATGVFYAYGATGLPTSFKIFIGTAPRCITIQFTDTGGTVRTLNTSTDSLPLGEWIPFVVTRTDTGVNAAVYRLYLYGGLFYTSAAQNSVHLTNASARHHIGVDFGAASNFFKGSVSTLAVYTGAKTDAECEDILRDMAQLSYDTTLNLKAYVQDSAGGWQDLSDQQGHDFLKSVTLKRSSDSRISTATITMQREQGAMRLGRYNDNPLNRPVPFSSSAWVDSTEWLAETRPVRVLVDRRALGTGFAQDAGSANWNNVFEGVLDSVGWGGPNEVTIECRDRGGRMQDVIIPVVTHRSTSPPTGNTVESVIQGIIDDAKGIAPPSTYINNWGLPNTGAYWGASGLWTIKVPTSSGWMVRAFDLENGINLLEAINRLADQIGWTFKSAWSEVDLDWRMTWSAPPRNQTHPNCVLAEDDVMDAQSIKSDVADIRNEIWISFVPFSGAVAADLAIPSVVTGTTTAAVGSLLQTATSAVAAAQTSTGTENNRATFILKSSQLDTSESGSDSISRFGVRRMGNSEDPTSNINTITETQLMALAILRDLQMPKMDAAFKLPCLPELVENDIVRVRQNGRWFTADQTLAAVDVTHTFSEGELSTSLGLRGRATAGTTRHLARESRPGVAPPATVDPTSLTDLVAGISTRDRRRIQALLIQLLPNHGRLPVNRGPGIRNGDFQMRSFGYAPPDTWAMGGTNVWGTAANLSTTVVESGQCSVKIISNVDDVLTSDYVPCRPSEVLALEARIIGEVAAGTSGTPRFTVEFFTTARAPISSSQTSGTVPSETVWATQRAVFTAPATAAYARVTLGKITGADAYHCQWVRLLAERQAGESYSNVRAYLTADQTITSKTEEDVVFDTDGSGRASGGWDDLGDFAVGSDAGTGGTTGSTFTAPEAGQYTFAANLLVSHATLVTATMRLAKKTAGPTYTTIAESVSAPFTGTTTVKLQVFATVWLARSEVVCVRVTSDNTATTAVLVKAGSGNSWFTAQRDRID